MIKKILIAMILCVLIVSVASADTNVAKIRIVGTAPGGADYANLTVQVSPGDGYIFLDVIPPKQTDTQNSIKLAKEVACSQLKIDCSVYDFFYTMDTLQPSINGPSAGMPLTVATMAALQNVPLREDVFFTGTIKSDGSIGTVSGVSAKMGVAEEFGAKLFIVAKGQSTGTVPEGIKVIEVSNVTEAFEYATGMKLSDSNVHVVSAGKFFPHLTTTFANNSEVSVNQDNSQLTLLLSIIISFVILIFAVKQEALIKSKKRF